MKVLVFGNSGSGKSTYAQALATREGLPHLDLDSIVWEPPARSPCSARLSQSRLLYEASLIHTLLGSLKATTANSFRAALENCTLLVFLNPGPDACLANNLRRAWEPHKYVSLEVQNGMLTQLQEWVSGYYQREDAWSYRAHREIFDSFAGPKVEHREAAAYAEMR